MTSFLHVLFAFQFRFWFLKKKGTLFVMNNVKITTLILVLEQILFKMSFFFWSSYTFRFYEVFQVDFYVLYTGSAILVAVCYFRNFDLIVCFILFSIGCRNSGE